MTRMRTKTAAIISAILATSGVDLHEVKAVAEDNLAQRGPTEADLAKMAAAEAKRARRAAKRRPS